MINFSRKLSLHYTNSAALEPCPLYLGKAIKVHCGLADLSQLALAKFEKIAVFEVTVE